MKDWYYQIIKLFFFQEIPNIRYKASNVAITGEVSQILLNKNGLTLLIDS